MRLLNLNLIPHPQSSVPAPGPLRVELHTGGEAGWQLIYHLPSAGLRLPPLAANAERRDDLWRHTCVELFVARAGEHERGYREFNFAPSGAWAAYDFDDYRLRSDALPAVPAPTITCSQLTDLRIAVDLPAASLPSLPSHTVRLGLSAVLEADDGTLSYWALAHPCARPDFHHRASFVLALD